jgi:hypothetical protein
LRQWADQLASGAGDNVQPRPSPKLSDFTAEDAESIVQGRAFSRDELFEELSNADLSRLGFAFEIPMFCFHGAEDQQTPIELAQQPLTVIQYGGDTENASKRLAPRVFASCSMRRHQRCCSEPQ